MLEPAIEEVRRISRQDRYRVIPVRREILADVRTPMEVLRVLKGASSHCYMLESMEDSQQWGRYTILGLDPSMEITCTDYKTVIRTKDGITEKTGHPKDHIRRIMSDNLSPRIPGFPPFTGGLVGYFSYDYMKYAEPGLDLDAEDQERFKDLDLMLFDRVIVFDNLRQKILLIANVRTDRLDEDYARAEAELDELASLVVHGIPADRVSTRITSAIRLLFDQREYCSMVEKVKEHIREGDVFQVVLSNRMDADVDGDLLDVYRALRTENPSPYMFYFSGGDEEIAGASPETLVRLEGRKVSTFPLAGTRRRGRTPEEDRLLEEDLLSDEKELAEHNMLVDLGRNDLGRVCRFDTVRVDRYLTVERFSHVMHIGSTVSGEIGEGKDAMDIVESLLPAGTLSGAPKLRACEIINELENNKRGIYGGAIGYLSFTGDMDTCIAIRIAYRKNGKVFVRSGAGIVADSVPEREYEECLHKARAVIRAIESAARGVDV